jgi:hypothetical protein
MASIDDLIGHEYGNGSEEGQEESQVTSNLGSNRNYAIVHIQGQYLIEA